MTPTTLELDRYQPDESVRMAFRHYVVATLKDRTLAGCRVYDNRVTDPQREEQPCIVVSTKDEPASRFQSAPTAYERTLTLWVDIFAEATEGDRAPQDLVDVMASQVERALTLAQMGIIQAIFEADRTGADCPFAFNPDKSGLTGTAMDQDADGIRLEAGARISWILVYVTEVDEAELVVEEITPFELGSVTWDLGGDGEIDAEDDIRPAQE